MKAPNDGLTPPEDGEEHPEDEEGAEIGELIVILRGLFPVAGPGDRCAGVGAPALMIANQRFLVPEVVEVDELLVEALRQVLIEVTVD